MNQPQPAKHFAFPPYHAELLNPKSTSDLAGVMNAQGMNVLTFPDKPGAVATSFEYAQQIAAEWNQKP